MNEIGSTLRTARERQQVTLVEAEQATKIRSKYLQALEDEDFGVLPGSVFAKGFLRTYADFLRLDGQRMVDQFNMRPDLQDEPEPGMADGGAAAAALRPRRHTGRWVLAILLLAGVAAALVLLLADDSTPTAPVVTADPVVPSVDAQAAAAEEAAETAAAKAAADKRADTAAATPAKLPPLTIVARTGDVWVEVTRGTEVLFSGTISAGERQRFSGRNLVVAAGNPEALLLVRGDVRLAGRAGVGTYEVSGRRMTAAGGSAAAGGA